jgi:hypothetical protein
MMRGILTRSKIEDSLVAERTSEFYGGFDVGAVSSVSSGRVTSG